MSSEGWDLYILGRAHSFLSTQNFIPTHWVPSPDTASKWLGSRHHAFGLRGSLTFSEFSVDNALMCSEIMAVVTFKRQEKYLSAFTVYLGQLLKSRSISFSPPSGDLVTWTHLMWAWRKGPCSCPCFALSPSGPASIPLGRPRATGAVHSCFYPLYFFTLPILYRATTQKVLEHKSLRSRFQGCIHQNPRMDTRIVLKVEITG